MTRDEIFAVLKGQIVRFVPEVTVAQVSLEHSLKDLGVDSIDRSDIIVGLKNELGIEISVSEFERTKKLHALVEALYSLSSKRP